MDSMSSSRNIKKAESHQRVLASDDSDEEHDDGDNKEEVDESPDGVARNDAQDPQDDENGGDEAKHMREVSTCNRTVPVSRTIVKIT